MNIFLVAFQQGDCDGGCNSGTLLLYLLAIFVGAGLLSATAWWRSRRTMHALLAIAAAVLGIFALAAGALHAYHAQSLAAGGHSVLRANQDYSHVLVAIRDMPSLNIVAGQRCIFSTVDCDAQPARISAVCGPHGETVLQQPDWSGFQRRPQEDYPVPTPQAVIDYPNACPGR